MKNIVLHPVTKVQIDGFINMPSSALLIHGRLGSGKSYIAKNIISRLLDIDLQKIEEHDRVFFIRPEKDSITIDQIRSVPNFIKLRVKNFGSKLSRAIIIENADLMGVEAQNAFLKTLEEVPPDTLIVLTASYKNQLQPTIISRLASLHVKPVSLQSANSHYMNIYKHVDIQRAYFMSGGCMGLMDALLRSADHELLTYIELSKSIYKNSQFDRLLQIDEIIKNKSNIDLLLEAMYIIARSALESSLQKNEVKIAKRWVSIQRLIINLQATQQFRPSPKLTLTTLMMSI